MIMAFADWGKITVPEVASTSPWPWVVGLVAVIAFALRMLENRRPGEARGIA